MFDRADLVPLPDLPPRPGSRQEAAEANGKNVAYSKSLLEIAGSTNTAHGTAAVAGDHAAAAHGPALSHDLHCHVVEACAMGDENVAVAISDGRLCHANISSTTSVPSRQGEAASEDKPKWRSWYSRHGRVLQLTYSPAHDALMTLEHATTAAGDQVFLGRYHRHNASKNASPWESCTIPLATSHASMAVCPRRGWAAVSTGSMVSWPSSINLWAVSPTSSKTLNGGNRRASAGFEHALALDLADLVGVDADGAHGGAGRDGGAKHIAIFGNTLAVATDSAVFLLRLGFDVKGETPSSHTTTSSGADSPSLLASRGEEGATTRSPETPSPSSRLTQRGKHKITTGTSSSTRTNSTSTDSPKELPPKASWRSGSRKGKTDDAGARGDARRHMDAKDGKAGGGRSSGGGVGKEGRDGVIHGSVVDAEDIVVCVLQEEGEEGQGLGVEEPTPPPPLLRSFDEDWDAFAGTRGERSEDPSVQETLWELETDRFGTEASWESFSATGNPARVDRVGLCEVVLARRVGAGEVVKDLRLMPASCGEDEGHEEGCKSIRSSYCSCPSSLSCRLVLLTNKAATVCLVYSGPIGIATRGYSSSSNPLSSPSSSSSSLLSTSSRAEGSNIGDFDRRGTRADFGRGETRYGAGNRRKGSGFGRSAVAGSGGIGAGSDDWSPRIFLRRCCRFNHDLLRASIVRSFLFAFTVEGIEVWTFPSDILLSTESRKMSCLAEASVGGSRAGIFADPSPRPCLLHIQKLAMDGVMPRSPPPSFVAVGGPCPGVLLFPAVAGNHASPEDTSLAFLAWQSRRRLRTDGAVDEPPPDETGGFLARPPYHQALLRKDAGSDQVDEVWDEKCAAWREGFCGFAGGNVGSSAAAAPLALFLRLRTPTEAFCLLAAAEARSPRPRLPTVSAAFLAAAEGLHGALTAEAVSCWRKAIRSAGRQGSNNNTGIPSVVRIETILPRLVQCWKRQRVAARCASLMARLWLEEAIASGAAASGGDACDPNVGSARAFARACFWMLTSDESVVDCCTRLGEAATRVLDTTPASVPLRKFVPEGSWMEVGDSTVKGPESESVDEEDDDTTKSSLSTSGPVCPFDLEEALTRAKHEAFLLRALGVGDDVALRSTAPVLRSPAASRRNDSTSLDRMLLGLVDYLHERDTKQASHPSAFGNPMIEQHRSMSLATAVVLCSRAPWVSCPEALSRALRALDEQEEALAYQVPFMGSSGTSSKSGRSRSGSSGSNPTRRPATDKRRMKPDGSPFARDSSSKGKRSERGKEELTLGGAALNEMGRVSGIRRGSSSIQAWIAIARAVLNGYAELAAENGGGNLSKPSSLRASGDLTLGADNAILQLACERHPALVGSRRGGTGPLARTLLLGGRQRPLVLALVHLTSMSGGSFGPHRARDLLRLTGDCFSAPLDPLQALRVLGTPGRQIAAHLESLQRASLDAAGGDGSPPTVHRKSFEPTDEKGSSYFGTAAIDRVERGDVDVPESAARDFLSRRCAASLARGDRGAREEELLAEALGAPPAWQASLARSRALDRAILRHLIAAHLDNLRALEGPSVGRATSSRDAPAGTGLAGAVGSIENDPCWADAVVPLLTGQASRAEDGAAEVHLAAIMALVREVTWRGGVDAGDGGGGTGMSPEEASEVATEAKRRLPAPTPASPNGAKSGSDGRRVNDTVVWGSGGVGAGMRRAPWPWPPRAVPPSAVGAIVALAASLPPSGKLLAGVDVMLQVTAEVTAAAKAEAAVAAGFAAAAASTARNAVTPRKPQTVSTGAAQRGLLEARTLVEEVSGAAERALLLYITEYCGKAPDLWASVTSHVRNVLSTVSEEGPEDGGTLGADVAAAQRLVGALLRTCGEQLGGEDLVRALPEDLTLMECLDEVERSLAVAAREAVAVR